MELRRGREKEREGERKKHEASKERRARAVRPGRKRTSLASCAPGDHAGIHDTSFCNTETCAGRKTCRVKLRLYVDVPMRVWELDSAEYVATLRILLLQGCSVFREEFMPAGCRDRRTHHLRRFE